MAKTSGIGDNFYVGGYDLSLDVASLDQVSGGPAAGDVTGIKQSGHARIGLLRSGDMQFTSYLDIANSTPYWVDNLHTLPTADAIASYFHAPAVGGAAACINGKQINYDPTRDNAGNLTLKTEIQSSKYGLEWGVQLTPGLRTDTAATVGAFYDQGSGGTFGAQAYLQVTAFTGTSVDIVVEHCTTSGGTYTTLIDFGSQTAVGAVRGSAAGTVNEFLKVVTSGTFTSVTFAVAFMKNPVSVVF